MAVRVWAEKWRCTVRLCVEMRKMGQAIVQGAPGVLRGSEEGPVTGRVRWDHLTSGAERARRDWTVQTWESRALDRMREGRQVPEMSDRPERGRHCGPCSPGGAPRFVPGMEKGCQACARGFIRDFPES